jgi:3-hydroxyisobutyryl-CoA hydrolase
MMASLCSELGCATHYIPSRRVPTLVDRLSALERPHLSVIDQTIEEFSSERQPEDPPTPFTGSARVALDYAFRHYTVEKIFADLQTLTSHPYSSVQSFARNTLLKLKARSPTSLKVALKAIREGKGMTLFQALNMELKIATAFCVCPSP